jgi:hypothetical protein
MPPTGLDYDERPANKSSAGPIIAILVAVIVLMVASFFGWYFLVFQKKGGVVGPSQASAESSEAAEPGAAPATAQGSLTVQTTPSDSVTTVDGNPVSGESPFVVPGLSAGTHRVTVVKPGYLPFEKDVTVAQGGATIVANLAHQKVNLILETDPAGAAVNILEDGVATPAAKGGETYPLERKPGKRYEVEALLRGYKPTRQSLDFTGEQNQRVRITLPPDPMLAAGGSATPPAPQADPEPAPEPASTSKPRKKKRSTPRKPSKPRSDPSPSPSKTQAATSTLRIGTNPGVPPAEVFVDGKRAGKTPIPGHKVTPGRHQVKFKWPGGKEIKKSVTVEDGGAQVVKAG